MHQCAGISNLCIGAIRTLLARNYVEELQRDRLRQIAHQPSIEREFQPSFGVVGNDLLLGSEKAAHCKRQVKLHGLLRHESPQAEPASGAAI
ncbi:hypothetical protein D3C71_1766980 [compost metagenome]